MTGRRMMIPGSYYWLITLGRINQQMFAKNWQRNQFFHRFCLLPLMRIFKLDKLYFCIATTAFFGHAAFIACIMFVIAKVHLT